jgi:hypothetical protein
MLNFESALVPHIMWRVALSGCRSPTVCTLASASVPAVSAVQNALTIFAKLKRS